MVVVVAVVRRQGVWQGTTGAIIIVRWKKADF